MISDLSAQTLKAKKAWSNIIHALSKCYCQARILHPAKLSFNFSGDRRAFQGKDKVTAHIHLVCITKDSIHMDRMKNNHKHKR
jgi:hypothetical protein